MPDKESQAILPTQQLSGSALRDSRGDRLFTSAFSNIGFGKGQPMVRGAFNIDIPPELYGVFVIDKESRPSLY